MKNVLQQVAKLTCLFLLLVSGCLPSKAVVVLPSDTAKPSQPIQPLTKEEALAEVKEYFENVDADYFLIEQGESADNWKIFVDPSPLKGWSHQCYSFKLYKRPMIIGGIGGGTTHVASIDTLQRPPVRTMSPLDVKNRYGTNANMRLKISKNESTNPYNPVAQRTRALIISGGGYPAMNKKRYWNDCSLIYQILRNKYGIPKDKICVAMSDGTDPANDQVDEYGVYSSSSLDLDFDNVADVEYAAKASTIRSILSSIYPAMNKGDHLFIFVTDHGSREGNQSKIVLWDGDTLSESELASLLGRFANKGVYVNVVMGQCYSGGFVNSLNKAGCVISTACTATQESYGSFLVPYDEYLYKWCLAVNGKNPADPTAVIASDKDSNGFITMEEAFRYAKSNDGNQAETPQYSSNPAMVGDDLAFNNLPERVNLYIRDTTGDTGKEPCVTNNDWNSPDIWVRNRDDGGSEHENPYLSDSHPISYIYVNVRNRSHELYKPKENSDKRWLNVYWANASTGLTKDAWRGMETYDTDNPTGGHIRCVPLDSIPALGSRKYKIIWALPEKTQIAGTNEDFHYCLFARITDKPYDDLNQISDIFTFNVKEDRTMAQKNLSIVYAKDLKNEISVFVRNTAANTQDYSLEIRPHTAMDAQLFTHANVVMSLSDPIYTAWKKGGSKMINIGTNASQPKKMQFKAVNSKLSNIRLNKSQFDKVSLKFQFRSTARSAKYTVDLVQRDANGNIVGGETFIIYPPSSSTSNAVEIQSAPTEDDTYVLSSNLDSGEYAFSWTGEDGIEVGTDPTLEVRTPSCDATYSLYALSSDGELSSASVTLDASAGIESLVTSGVENGILTVMLKKAEGKNPGTLVINETQNGTFSRTLDLQCGSHEVEINTSSYPSGIYAVSYVRDGVVVNSKKFTKQ